MSRLTLLLIVCFGIDVSNPLLPGSQRFKADESVDVVHAERSRVTHPTIKVVPRPDTGRVQRREDRAPRLLEAPRKLRLARRNLAPPVLPHGVHDLTSESEDH